MTDLSPEAELMLLIMASHGGTMTRKEAEAEARRVCDLSREEYLAWFTKAKRRARRAFVKAKTASKV